MRLPKAKRTQLRKTAVEKRQELLVLGIDIDYILNVLEDTEESHEALKEKHKEERTIMAAINNLSDAVAKLTTAVDAAVTALSTPPTGVPEAEVQTQADMINAQVARLVTATPTTTTPPAPTP